MRGGGQTQGSGFTLACSSCRIKGGRSPELSGRPACLSSGLKKMWLGDGTYVTPADSDQRLLLRFLQRETDKEPSSSSLSTMTESDTAKGQR